MIRAAAIAAAALVAAAPLLAAEGGAIRGGEHDGFTRIVMTVQPTTEWSLETAADRATIHFPGKRLAFDLGGVFDKIPRTRIRAVRAEPAGDGTTISVDLGCDCRVSTSFVGAQYLALDIADRDAPTAVPVPAPEAADAETPEARAAREAVAVSSAEQVLIRQIERAADQGLVEMSNPGARQPAPARERPPARQAPPPQPAAAIPPAEPVATAPEAPAEPPAPVPAPTNAPATEGDLVAMLNEQDQIQATTVFDRDSRSARDARAAAAAAPPPVCLPDDRLDVAAWSNGQPLPAQLPVLRRHLIGEFDTPNPQGLADLARLYIRFGFGAEAESLLEGFAAAPGLDDRALLVDLARAVEGRAVTADGPLAVAVACPGRHGLWQALGGVAPVWRDAASFDGVQRAFEELPVDLRLLLGPGLAGRLLDAGHVAEARMIHDTAVRPGEAPGPDLALVEARLMAADGQPVEAVQAMTALLEANGHASLQTLTELVRVALDAGMPIPDRIVTDLRAAALQYRGAAPEAELRGLLAEALARRAELPAAIREIRAAAAALPAAAAGYDTLAVRLLAEADPAAVGGAAYAETALAAADLIARAPAGDPARTTIARQLIALGLPDPALGIIAPALAHGGEPARLVAAEARLRLGEPEAARAALGALAGPAPAELRARSFVLAGAYGEAQSALARGGLATEAAAYAWPSGDWAAAHAAADDPERLAMAAYMTARSGGAAPAATADPAALTPGQAFQEPLPPLDRPSLDAARRLLSAGGQVGGFVQGVLAEE